LGAAGALRSSAATLRAPSAPRVPVSMIPSAPGAHSVRSGSVGMHLFLHRRGRWGCARACQEDAAQKYRVFHRVLHRQFVGPPLLEWPIGDPMGRGGRPQRGGAASI